MLAVAEIGEGNVRTRFNSIKRCDNKSLDEALQIIRPDLDMYYEIHMKGDKGLTSATGEIVHLPKPFSQTQMAKMVDYVQEYVTEKIETTTDDFAKSKIPFFVKTAQALVPTLVYGQLTGRSTTESLEDFFNEVLFFINFIF